MKNSKAKKIIAGLSSMLIAASAVPAVSLPAVAADNVAYGDANCDGEVNLADAVLIMQYLANPAKYSITEKGLDNADVSDRGNGITNKDALAVQKYTLGLVSELPESWIPPVTSDTLIHLKGTSVEVEGDYATVNGTVVTIDHSGSFYIDGTLDNGQICVNIPDEAADPETVKIFLNGADITGRSAPAIYVVNAENTSINLVDGTTNTISDGDTAYTGDWLGAAVIEAKDDITFKGGTEGTGTLELNANTQDGISCNNDIKFTGGKITVKTLNATDKTDAVKGKTSVTVKSDAVLKIDAEGDGIKSSKGNVSIEGGAAQIKAGNDAVQAGTTIDISGGALTAGGDRGLTAAGGVNITGGDVVATATDNQVDQTLLKSSQVTMLFNCIDCPDNTDLMWKKANAFLFELNGVECNFTKKYKYVLVSSLNFTQGVHLNIKNTATDSYIVHGADNSNEFVSTGAVTVFEDVDPGYIPDPVPARYDGYNITLSGSAIASNAPESAASVSNSELTITEPGVFAVSGNASDVRIVVDVDKTAYPDGVVELDLAGAEITNSTAAPIYVKSIGDEVQIVAKKGTVNTISDGASHTDTYTDSEGTVNTVDAAIFSHDDLKIKGTGALTINGNTADGVVSKNDLKIYNGDITVNAADDGIRGKDSVTVGNANDTDFSTLKLTINAKAGDGIKSTATDAATAGKSYGIVTLNGGAIDITSYADGIQAEQDVVINGGDITIYTFEGSGYTGSGSSTGSQNPWGGGRPGGGGMGMDGNSNKTDISAKGIKAVGLYDAAGTTWQSGGNIAINGGNIIVDSSDDCIHCGGNIVIKGGNMKLASADDALHSDHDLTLGENGGAASDFGIYVTKCYEGVEGENIYQYSGTVLVNADDDGYNAAGGADGSGNNNPGGWNPGGGFGSAGNNTLLISGGIAIVQSASGDHDAFDSNGNLSVTGGIVIANGQEPLDSDGSNTATGGTVAAVSSQSSGTVAAGAQFTLADASGNVIVSFKTMRAMGAVTMKHTDGTVNVYTGGTIIGGTDLITLDSSQPVYADGTIAGGTAVTTGSSSGGGNQFPWG